MVALPAIQGVAIGEQYVATVEESIEGKEFLDEERVTYTLLDLRLVLGSTAMRAGYWAGLNTSAT